MDYKITIQDVTEQNKAEKLQQTIDRLAKAFKLPITIKQSIGKREEYAYQAQRDLYDRWTLHVARIADGLYLGLCRIFDLPITKTFSKSLDTLQKALDEEKPLSIRGQIIYNPESRQPIKRKDWESLLSAIEKFLNRRLRGAEKKIVLENRRQNP